MAAVSQDELLTLRDIIVQDTLALQKWGRVVDRIVTSPADALRIKLRLDSLKDGSFEEGVLQSLRLFSSRGGSRSELADVLRSKSIGLNAVAERIQEPLTTLFAGTTTLRATRVALWREVGRVVENFSGRIVEMGKTHKKLGDAQKRSRESGAVSIVSISGLGGVGKSTLARKYAFKYRDFYDGNVAWINAETIESLRASLTRLAKGLGLQLGYQPPRELLIEKLFGYFQNKKCLFIYDNVENLAEFKQFLPNFVDPSGQVPYVLVTSRRTDLNPLPVNEIHLDVLTTEEAVELIQKMLPHSRKENAMKLADKLQRLPLALQQALAYIRDTSVGDHDESIVEYMKEFDKSGADLLGDERFRDHDDYSSTTFATWQITLARIKEMEDGPPAIKVINALAYLNPDLISTGFLKLVFEKTRPGLKLLERFSMIHVNKGKRVVIHRLVQRVVRLRFSEREEEQLKSLVVAIDGELEKDKLNDVTRECMSHGLHLLPFHINPALQMCEEIIPVAERVFGENDSNVFKLKLCKAMAVSLVGKFVESYELLFHVNENEVSIHDAEVVRHKRRLGQVHRDIIGLRNLIALCKVKLSQQANSASYCRIV